MELKEVLGRRRSIRFYLPFRPVERAKVQKMLEAARHASCVGNINSARAVVIWKEQASEQVIKAITPLLGYQQMQTAPCFILWYHEKMAYEINNWIQSLKNMADMRLVGVDGGGGAARPSPGGPLARPARPPLGSCSSRWSTASPSRPIPPYGTSCGRRKCSRGRGRPPGGA